MVLLWIRRLRLRPRSLLLRSNSPFDHRFSFGSPLFFGLPGPSDRRMILAARSFRVEHSTNGCSSQKVWRNTLSSLNWATTWFGSMLDDGAFRHGQSRLQPHSNVTKPQRHSLNKATTWLGSMLNDGAFGHGLSRLRPHSQITRPQRHMLDCWWFRDQCASCFERTPNPSPTSSILNS